MMLTLTLQEPSAKLFASGPLTDHTDDDDDDESYDW